MRTEWTHAQTRTILRIWAVPCMARGVRRRSLPPSKRGRRRIVLSGPSVLPRLSVSGPRSRRQPARQNRNRDARPPWISSPPPPDSWRSLRRATYPPLRRAPPPPANHAATASRCPMSLKSPYKRGFSSPPTHRCRSGADRRPRNTKPAPPPGLQSSDHRSAMHRRRIGLGRRGCPACAWHAGGARRELRPRGKRHRRPAEPQAGHQVRLRLCGRGRPLRVDSGDRLRALRHGPRLQPGLAPGG